MLKRCFPLLLAAVLAFSGCGSREEQSASEEKNPAPVESQEEQAEEFTEEETFYQEVLLNFGGVMEEDEKGRERMVPTVTSLYYGEPWESAESLGTGHYYSWYMSMMGKDETPWEELVERYASPFGENSGWFFPQEYFEPLVQEYFDVSVQQLRSDPLFYHPEEGGYSISGGGGKGERPEILLNRVEKEGELRRFHITLPYTSQPEVNRVLTIRLGEDGSYQYQSYLEEE